ncbi:hypothetical protein M0657_006372 [Pyricularia oryzae]|nr:hypothetical protein M0657_006372 [Pyricularia oryzae]KAI7931185.1 hypothetical protein M9X92_000471 [Pyricularia oryzae]
MKESVPTTNVGELAARLNSSAASSTHTVAQHSNWTWICPQTSPPGTEQKRWQRTRRCPQSCRAAPQGDKVGAGGEGGSELINGTAN